MDLPQQHRCSESMSNKDSSWKVDLEEIQKTLIQVAREAGEMITSAHPSTSSLDTKKNSVDLVTQTDKAVEVHIAKTLQSKYPTFKFMGEETYEPGMKLTDAPTFVVDPIDGTTNFVHGYPYVSVSLGFAVLRQPVVGVVYNPFTRQLYRAIKGQGSFLEDEGGKDEAKRLPLRNPPEPLTGLSDALIAIEWGSDRDGSTWETKHRTWVNLGKSKAAGGAMAHSLRSFGSAALNLCGVAAGNLDLYWEGGCWAWDVCAGMVILKEAGGIVADGNPGTWDVPVDHRKYLAVRGAPTEQQQKAVVEEFWTHVEGKMEYEH